MTDPAEYLGRMPDQTESITSLLAAWRQGNALALDRLVTLIQHELTLIAQRYLHRERADHTLQASALVNEAYLRMLGRADVPWHDRVHFFAAAAQVMRHVLVDYGRKRQRSKRRPDALHITIDDAVLISPHDTEEILAIHEALERLAELDPRKSRVVELRFFGGLSVDETASILGVTVNTVVRDWNFARAWLRRELS